MWHLLDHGGYEAVKDDTLGSFVEKYNLPALKITADDEELKRASMRCSFVPIVDDRGVFVGTVDSRDIVHRIRHNITFCFLVIPAEDRVPMI